MPKEREFMSNLSKAMKEFWESKTLEEINEINNKRSMTNSECIYIKKVGFRSQACNPEEILDKLCLGYKIIKTKKNLSKIKKYFDSLPEEFFC